MVSFNGRWALVPHTRSASHAYPFDCKCWASFSFSWVIFILESACTVTGAHAVSDWSLGSGSKFRVRRPLKILSQSDSLRSWGLRVRRAWSSSIPEPTFVGGLSFYNMAPYIVYCCWLCKNCMDLESSYPPASSASWRFLCVWFFIMAILAEVREMFADYPSQITFG